ILHRYIAIRAWREGRAAFERFAIVMAGRIEPIYALDVSAAAALVDRHATLSARDLLHLAVMRRLGVRQIVTADGEFDGLLSVERLDPATLTQWRERVLSG